MSTPTETKYLFHKPQHQAKWFVIDDPNVTVLFEKTKISPNTLAQMLPALCKLADTNAPYANHTLRATGIVLLKEAGFSDKRHLQAERPQERGQPQPLRPW